MSIASRLYHGGISIDFVGRWRTWFLISGLAMLISVGALFYPGLHFGIDFKGGGVFTVQPAKPVTQGQVSTALGPVAKVVQLTTEQAGKPRQVIVQTESLSSEQIAKVRADLARVTGVQPSQVSNSVVGSKWGSTVTRKAIIALVVFLLVTIAYVSLRFDFKMAVSAIIALIHDLLITAGVYALARFEVTPATVIGLLTILGYSLYDTVVVFDKVRENTGELGSMSRVTYSDAANRAVNQTLVRSLNTSLASLLPIAALLVVGAFLLGAETIKDLALALFVGVAAGTYSSVFIATPFVALWKETEPRNRALRARVARLATVAPVGAEPRPARQAQPAVPGQRRRKG
ncbi:MAG TPA: protein translocase subunit SecF, partial [Actinomycetes bacterium]|nr:protein translocase subunit SecF [Actinomycetes bacterium]